MGAFYCSVCRQTFFSGKSHIFGRSHQSRLRVVLLKFLEKVKEARRTIKNPQVEKFDCTRHKRTFWCYCCGLEVERNVTDGNMTVMYGGLMEHMATPEHKTNTHKFWWDNKADPKLRDKVVFSEEETERFKAEVAKALDSFVEKEDELIKQQADMIRAQEKHRQEILQSLIEVCFRRMPWHLRQSRSCPTHPNAQPPLWTRLFLHFITVYMLLLFVVPCTGCCSNLISPPGLKTSILFYYSSHFTPLGTDQQAGPSWVDPMVEGQWAGPGQGLTFIGYQDSSNSGNVHTGAVPPWLQDDPLEGGSGTAAVLQEIGPSLQDFLKQKEQEKLKKLPPNRVGANFDHSSQTDANWLPSFGRVWNSGRRWQSRHQFREEEKQTRRRKRRRECDPEGSKKTKTTE
ncbi:centrosomal AT-AC splicing factor [Polymixia lowei]